MFNFFFIILLIFFQQKKVIRKSTYVSFTLICLPIAPPPSNCSSRALHRTLETALQQLPKTVCMDTCITPQKNKNIRQCVVFVVIPAVPAPLFPSNNHFLFPFSFGSSPSFYSSKIQRARTQFSLYLSLSLRCSLYVTQDFTSKLTLKSCCCLFHLFCKTAATFFFQRKNPKKPNDICLILFDKMVRFYIWEVLVQGRKIERERNR